MQRTPGVNPAKSSSGTYSTKSTNTNTNTNTGKVSEGSVPSIPITTPPFDVNTLKNVSSNTSRQHETLLKKLTQEPKNEQLQQETLTALQTTPLSITSEDVNTIMSVIGTFSSDMQMQFACFFSEEKMNIDATISIMNASSSFTHDAAQTEIAVYMGSIIDIAAFSRSAEQREKYHPIVQSLLKNPPLFTAQEAQEQVASAINSLSEHHDFAQLVIHHPVLLTDESAIEQIGLFLLNTYKNFPDLRSELLEHLPDYLTKSIEENLITVITDIIYSSPSGSEMNDVVYLRENAHKFKHAQAKIEHYKNTGYFNRISLDAILHFKSFTSAEDQRGIASLLYHRGHKNGSADECTIQNVLKHMPPLTDSIAQQTFVEAIRDSKFGNNPITHKLLETIILNFPPIHNVAIKDMLLDAVQTQGLNVSTARCLMEVPTQATPDMPTLVPVEVLIDELNHLQTCSPERQIELATAISSYASTTEKETTHAIIHELSEFTDVTAQKIIVKALLDQKIGSTHLDRCELAKYPVIFNSEELRADVKTVYDTLRSYLSSKTDIQSRVALRTLNKQLPSPMKKYT